MYSTTSFLQSQNSIKNEINALLLPLLPFTVDHLKSHHTWLSLISFLLFSFLSSQPRFHSLVLHHSCSCWVHQWLLHWVNGQVPRTLDLQVFSIVVHFSLKASPGFPPNTQAASPQAPPPVNLILSPGSLLCSLRPILTYSLGSLPRLPSSLCAVHMLIHLLSTQFLLEHPQLFRISTWRTNGHLKIHESPPEIPFFHFLSLSNLLLWESPSFKLRQLHPSSSQARDAWPLSPSHTSSHIQQRTCWLPFEAFPDLDHFSSPPRPPLWFPIPATIHLLLVDLQQPPNPLSLLPSF